MKITGKITKVFETKTGVSKSGKNEGKEWKANSFLVETEEEYDNLYLFELFGADKVDNFFKYNKVDDVVDVEFNIKTTKWKESYFTKLAAWKVFKADGGESKPDPKGDLPF